MNTIPMQWRRVGCALLFGWAGASFAAPGVIGATVSTERVEVDYRTWPASPR